jgi:hypothetical protein
MHKVAEKTFVDRHSSGEKGNHATSHPGIAGESLVNYEWKLRKRMHRRYAFRGKGARDISFKTAGTLHSIVDRAAGAMTNLPNSLDFLCCALGKVRPN